jgi:hypothetical protein
MVMEQITINQKYFITMRNTLVFLGILIAGVLTWFGYAFLASLISDNPVRDCLWSDTVITFFFATGWILPLLVGFDLYRYLYRNEIRRERRIDREIREIKTNTFEFKGSRHYSHGVRSLRKQINLN